MSQSTDFISALDLAKKRAIALDAPLRERLQVIADEVRALSGAFADAVDVFVGRLQKAEAGAQAPAIGERLPDFLLPDQNGRLVSLEELLAKGPVIVAFLRGHWCPYCQMTAIALSEVADAARAKGARIVAICPENRQYTQRLVIDSDDRFPILSDVDNGYAVALNLAIWVDDEMARLILSAGWDIPAYNASPSWVLPIPATFVLDRTGIVRARYVNADYRTRMEIDDIVDTLNALP
jgi:peroxiredoxin